MEKIKTRSLGIQDALFVHTFFHKLFISQFDYYSKESRKKVIEKWSLERIEKRLRSDKYLFEVAGDSKGLLIGKYFAEDKIASILWIIVDKQFHGKGVGKILLKKWEEWAMEKGAQTLRISTSSEANIKYYEKIGFQLSQQNKIAYGRKTYLLYKIVSHNKVIIFTSVLE